MTKKQGRLMAYILMPLIFAMIGYGVLYIAGAPIVKLVYNVGSMFLTQDAPSFDTDLGTVFEDSGLTAEGQSETVAISTIVVPKFGEQYGELSCERIGLSAPVYYGDSNEILRVGAGQYIGSFLPGYGRLIMLCAHNTTFFRPLQNVEVGDIFVFKTSYGVFEYQVTETAIKDHNDSSAYNLLIDSEQLIMYTCYPFETLAGTNTDRLFVYCEKISGPVVVD